MKSAKSLLVSVGELGIILVAGLANVAWYCAKKTRIGPAIRNFVFNASAHLKGNRKS